MPSQEDYLNELLNGVPGKGGTARNDAQAPDLEDLEDMSEEQIARLLEEGKAGSPSYAEDSAEDVLDMAGGSGDQDLEEIQDLLRKSDRNETVDAQEHFREEESPADRLLEDIERAGEAEVGEKAVDIKNQKALEKKRLKAEKKAAREAAKAEKKKKSRAKKKGGAHTEQKESGQKQEWEEIQEYDTLADKDLLDSIVSEAGKVEHAEPESAPNLLELAAALEAERNIDPSQEIPYMNDDSSSDMDSGILALEPDEIDDFIPDISETGREEAEPKKKGMVSRFVDFLMEEEEENENVQLSDENQEIIREMDNEEAEKAKKKTQKKSKKKEAKKDKKKKEQKPKKAKPPKPKKEKKPKEADPYPGRKLSFKKAFPVVLLGISVGAAVFILVQLSADYSVKQTAKDAFEAGDYQTCYVNLHGKRLNETEEQMYNKSQCILHIRMWYREYELLEADGSEAKALDSLIQSVYEYPSLSAYAYQWDAQNEVNEIYLQLLDILSGKYGVSEAQAQEIGALESDIAYTRAILALVGDAGYGQESVSDETPAQSESQDSPEGEVLEQPDVLPEEAEMETGEYVDNQG